MIFAQANCSGADKPATGAEGSLKSKSWPRPSRKHRKYDRRVVTRDVREHSPTHRQTGRCSQILSLSSTSSGAVCTDRNFQPKAAFHQLAAVQLSHFQKQEGGRGHAMHLQKKKAQNQKTLHHSCLDVGEAGRVQANEQNERGYVPAPKESGDTMNDAAIAMQLTGAELDILEERRRQITHEGWTEAHDDMHDSGELAEAAGCYVCCAGHDWSAPNPPAEWPWDDERWKPTTARRDLVKAAALIVAEIERLDRAEAKV